MAKKTYNRIGNIDFSAGSEVTLDLKPSNPIVGYHLDVETSLDIDATLTLRDESPLTAITRIDLEMDSEILQRWSAAQLYMYNYFLTGTNGPLDGHGTSVTDPDLGRFHLFLPCKLMNSGFPGLSYLDPTRSNSFQLRVSWDTAAGAGMVSAGTMDYNSSTHMTVTQVELTPPQGTSSQEFLLSMGLPNKVLIARQIQRTFDSAVSDATIALQKNHDIVGFLLRVSTGTTSYVLSDAALNELALVENGTHTVMQGTYNEWQNMNDWEQRLSEDYIPGAPTVSGSRVEGGIYVNLIEQGISDILKPQGLSSLELVMDVDADTRIDLTVLELAPAGR